MARSYCPLECDQPSISRTSGKFSHLDSHQPCSRRPERSGGQKHVGNRKEKEGLVAVLVAAARFVNPKPLTPFLSTIKWSVPPARPPARRSADPAPARDPFIPPAAPVAFNPFGLPPSSSREWASRARDDTDLDEPFSYTAHPIPPPPSPPSPTRLRNLLRSRSRSSRRHSAFSTRVRPPFAALPYTALPT